MKLENNWRHKSLENLEKEQWVGAESDTRLVKRIYELRKMPIHSFSSEDLRLMIGQQFSLDYLVPLALETLTDNLFAEGDLFEGDLLKNVLAIKTEFWDKNEAHWLALNALIKDRRAEIEARKFDTSNFVRRKF